MYSIVIATFIFSIHVLVMPFHSFSSKRNILNSIPCANTIPFIQFLASCVSVSTNEAIKDPSYLSNSLFYIDDFFSSPLLFCCLHDDYLITKYVALISDINIIDVHPY
ncbi:hypothetical protein L6452_43414 [Arctium lappa]|uniref:Uncharacterized protein n=1 Tax=Arctium lappa TaxID=4217 RepID=A0ACB8XD40_ARCLA|nr:hypothetical protein L6452_43414 [Arctium lappa]